MKRFLRTLQQDDAGQDTTEYVLLVALIALAVTAGMMILASNINAAFSAAGGELQTQTGGSPP
jgi:Flp pilus assembly pilin Flp